MHRVYAAVRETVVDLMRTWRGPAVIALVILANLAFYKLICSHDEFGYLLEVDPQAYRRVHAAWEESRGQRCTLAFLVGTLGTVGITLAIGTVARLLRRRPEVS